MGNYVCSRERKAGADMKGTKRRETDERGGGEDWGDVDRKGKTGDEMSSGKDAEILRQK